jgi:hypothetical protein
MKIIKLDENNYTADRLYDALYDFFYYGAEYLPWIFLKKVYLDGEMFQLPRWITQKHYDSIDADTRKLMDELNWEYEYKKRFR